MNWFKKIKFIIDNENLTEVVFEMKYNIDTYNWLIESQAFEKQTIKWWWKSYIPLSIEKDNKYKNILVYLTRK